MKVRYTLRAVADIDAIGRYLFGRSSVGAMRVRTALVATIDLIATYPVAGRRQTDPRVR